MTAATITPIAIDAFVSIESVRVVDRHRHDLGDLHALANSIADIDLLNPITLTREGRLIAGQRRLEACRLLGWDTVPVRYVDSLDDAAKLLRAERDENTCRKDMLPSELAALGAALYAIEAEQAKGRQREAGEKYGRGIASGPRAGSYSHETRDAVGEALGLAGRTYGDLHATYELANDAEAEPDKRELAQAALAEMDNGAGIKRAAARLRRELAEVKPETAAEAPPAADNGHDPDWIPAANEKGQQAAARRRELIREMAPSGSTSDQIAGFLGIGQKQVKKIAKENEIQIVADRVIGRSRHRIDSNRIIREIVQNLEHNEMSLGLVRFAELDTSLIENWTTSLSKSIRVLNRLNKQLKEVVQ